MVRHANARRAVGAHLNVQWIDATVKSSQMTYSSRNEAVQAALETLSYSIKPAANIKTSDSASTGYTPTPENAAPTLIFFYSTAQQPKQHARESELAWEELFRKESDFSVFIPGRFFTVLRVDVTSIRKSANNRYICSENAPTVVLTHANGDVAEVLEGTPSIKSLAIARTMCNILTADGFLKKPSAIPDLNGLMVALQKAEEALLVDKEDLEKLKTKLADVRGRAAKKVTIIAKSDADKANESAPVEAAKKAVENSEKKLKDKQTDRYNILTKEYAMLQDLGLPTSKMPPEPESP